jgi:hypothetical protein
MNVVTNDIAAFHALRPIRFRWLVTFAIDHTFGPHTVSALSLSLTLTTDFDAGQRLLLSFSEIVDLEIDWTQRSPVSVDVIEIEDIRSRGWEGIHSRVAEGEGMFAFSCRDFRASIESP